MRCQQQNRGVLLACRRVNHELVNDCAKSAPFKVKSRLMTQVIVLSAKRAVEPTPALGAQQLLNENF
jgi:hypothetical protein